MEAALFYGGKDIRIETVSDPDPESGQVQVESKRLVSVAVICTDIMLPRSSLVCRGEVGMSLQV